MFSLCVNERQSFLVQHLHCMNLSGFKQRPLWKCIWLIQRKCIFQLRKRSGGVFVFESLTILTNINKNLVDFAMWGSLKTQLAHCLLCFPVLWHSFNLKPLDYHVSLDFGSFRLSFAFVTKEEIQKTRFYKLHRNHQAPLTTCIVASEWNNSQRSTFLESFFFRDQTKQNK